MNMPLLSLRKRNIKTCTIEKIAQFTWIPWRGEAKTFIATHGVFGRYLSTSSLLWATTWIQKMLERMKNKVFILPSTYHNTRELTICTFLDGQVLYLGTVFFSGQVQESDRQEVFINYRDKHTCAEDKCTLKGIQLMLGRQPLISQLFQELSFPSHCPNLPLCH